MSKSFLVQRGCDAAYWEGECMDRFGVFDHDGLFGTADGALVVPVDGQRLF